MLLIILMLNVIPILGELLLRSSSAPRLFVSLEILGPSLNQYLPKFFVQTLVNGSVLTYLHI